jgi:hypothetical protein
MPHAFGFPLIMNGLYMVKLALVKLALVKLALVKSKFFTLDGILSSQFYISLCLLFILFFKSNVWSNSTLSKLIPYESTLEGPVEPPYLSGLIVHCPSG